MKHRVTLILSNHNKAVQYEWLVDFIDKEKFELSFIFLNPGDSFVERFVASRNLKFERITFHSKKDIPKAISGIWRFLKRNKTETVHTHLFEANICGLTAAWLAGIRKRIYTRHHSSYHHKFFPKAIKYDRYCNFMATHIVAITEMVKRIVVEQEGADEKKIRVIPHGFNLDEFRFVDAAVVEEVKRKYNLQNAQKVIGVVSRFTYWKGIHHIIPAFKKLLTDFPGAVLVLANANGNYKSEISKQLKETLDGKNYRVIEFENNSFALFKCFDAFVHVPIDDDSEAYGQVYVEALAAGVPSVFTLSGIAHDFILNGENALVVGYQSSDEIYAALKRLFSDDNLRKNLIANGQQSISKLFTFERFLKQTETLYLE